MRCHVAIVGAGMAGLSCARALAETEATVTVFDKARGPGGRMCTRRRSDAVRFDHGAQFFTARDPAFVERVRRWHAADVVVPWAGPFGRHERALDGWRPEAEPVSRWLGSPRMSALSRHLAEGLDVRLGHRITALERNGDRWMLRAADQAQGDFDAVLLTCPGPQSAALLPRGPVRERAERLGYEPCFALMGLIGGSSADSWPFAGGSLDDDVIRWLAREDAKPGRSGPPRMLVHAASAWSARHFDDDPTVVQRLLTDRVRERTGVELVDARVHRWRYARASPGEPSSPCVFDARSGLGLAGDGLVGPRVESAFASGVALADALATWLRQG